MDEQLLLRQKLRAAMTQEIAERTKTHQAQIAAFNSAIARRRAVGAKAPTIPLAMLAHGDSWFDYPLAGNNWSWSHTDIIVQLQSLGNVNPHILNLSQWGDATTAEMSWPRQRLMITALQNPANWFATGKPDAILFSGGGNDIVGDQFCIFLDYAGVSASGLDATRFQEALGMVEASYRDLFAFRDRFAPNVPIFSHCYDFAIPNGAHPCVGPWLKPSLDFCGYDLVQGTAIVYQALIDFKTLPNNFILVQTQGTFHPVDWANELHPYPHGFRMIAETFVMRYELTFLAGYWVGKPA